MEDNQKAVIVDPPAKFKSAVWKYFGFRKIEGRTLENETICRLCEHTINYTCKNTSNMAIHLRRKHAIETTQTSNLGDKPTSSITQNSVSVNTSSKGQLSIQNAFQAKLAPGSSRAKLITRHLALYIATDLRPYSIVDSRGFKKLVNCLEPKYTLPSRTTLSRKVIPDLYEEVKEEVKVALKASHSVAMTTDGWTSRATQSYITITAHFIDDQWQLKNMVLQTQPIFDSHTGANIADVLKQAIDDWELKRPHGQQPITSDSAANVCLAVGIAEMSPHIRCFAHIINLAAQQALHINEVQRLLGRVRRIVTFFHKSSTAKYQLELKQKLLQLPNHQLINEVKTRWNSAYDMIERYLEQQPAVMAALMSPNIKREKDLDTLSSDDITLAEHIIKVLGPLKTITTILCESNMPTLSMVRPLIHNLSQAMAPNAEDVKAVSQMKAAILNSLSKRYTDMEIQTVLLQSSFIDPRFKALPFLSQQEKLEIHESIRDLAEAMSDSSLEYCIVKSEPCSDLDARSRIDPPLPDLPVQMPTASEEEVVNPPKKTALSSLFGDVFVLSHIPATLTKKDMIRNELKGYTGEECVDVNTDPLKWWHLHELKYPFLSKVAKYLLSIQATSVPSERVFSTAGDIVTAQRATLAPDQVDKLIFLKTNVTF